jgi:hypothetical protein
MNEYFECELAAFAFFDFLRGRKAGPLWCPRSEMCHAQAPPRDHCDVQRAARFGLVLRRLEAAGSTRLLTKNASSQPRDAEILQGATIKGTITTAFPHHSTSVSPVYQGLLQPVRRSEATSLIPQESGASPV